MNNKEILKQAIALKPDERFMIVEGILKSLDESDEKIDAIWAQEAKKRLEAYRKGELKGIPIEEIFENNRRKFFFQNMLKKNWKMLFTIMNWSLMV